MASRSARLRVLEREFIENLLVRIVRPDCSFDLVEFDARFRAAWPVLEEGVDTNSPDVLDLLHSLRPDPISGISTVVRRRLNELQPGRMALPNPGYTDGDVLRNDPRTEVLDSLGDVFKGKLDAAAKAYLAYRPG